MCNTHLLLRIHVHLFGQVNFCTGINQNILGVLQNWHCAISQNSALFLEFCINYLGCDIIIAFCVYCVVSKLGGLGKNWYVHVKMIPCLLDFEANKSRFSLRSNQLCTQGRGNEHKFTFFEKRTFFKTMDKNWYVHVKMIPYLCDFEANESRFFLPPN